ncbi:hypothetical protein ACTI_70450 [Actinoplanes sp. OR16]|nr:hypothetical protein ACTI_70450 [Actinoplanes sp. OR16]
MAFAVAGPAVASPALAAPAFPSADGRCVDETDVLDGLCDRITSVLRQDEKASSDEIAVAVVPTTGDASIETWSTGLFNDWGVGEAGADNGVLLVVAVDDHHVRLATGRGMAQRLDDTTAAEIVNTVITPEFSADHYAAGVLNGLDAVRRALGHAVDSSTSLASLTPAVSDPEVVDDDGSFPTDGSFAGDGSFLDDGSFPTDDYAYEDSSSGAPVWLFVLAVFGILGLFGWAANRAGGSSRGLRTTASNDHHQHHTTGAAIGLTSSSSSSSWSSSSDSSSSGFGGGSSDGGGSSGSW